MGALGIGEHLELSGMTFIIKERLNLSFNTNLIVLRIGLDANDKEQWVEKDFQRKMRCRIEGGKS